MSEWDDIGTCLSNRRGLAALGCLIKVIFVKCNRLRNETAEKEKRRRPASEKLSKKKKKSMQFLAAVLSIDPKGL